MTTTAPATASQNKFEKFKAEKDGLAVKSELEQFAQMGWEAMEATDREHRLKWLGVFFRPVTPGKFMMRMRVPNGVITSQQLRVLAEVVQRYGEDGSADITTRQNLQLRGVRIEDLPDIFRRFEAVGLTSIQSGMDNVRNITGSPVAGIDADELIDTRELCQQVQDMITNHGQGNPAFTNLPRKFNIAIAGCRDNSVHAEINDIAFVPAYKNDVLGFNVVVGGFFSAKRCAAAVPMDVWVAPDAVVALCEAILIVYRDHGLRANRQKARLMWLLDEWGMDKFRAEVEQQLGQPLELAADKDEIAWDKRDHIGVYAQKQVGFSYVGLHIPVGRLTAHQMFELSRLAEVYGSSELRLTVEQNVIIPHVPETYLERLLQEPLLSQFSIAPGHLSRSLVSCTGAQFCNFALIETKQRAVAVIRELETAVTVPRSVRIHWTGCPNSCGQPQVADIGLMGTKVRKNGKTVEGVDIYMGGKVGKDAHLGECVIKSVPCEDLKPVLIDLLVKHFDATVISAEVVNAESWATATPDVTPSAIHPLADRPLVELPTVLQSGLNPPPPMPTAVPATVQFARSARTVTCTETDLVLSVAEQSGVSLDSSCRSGTCGTCKAKVLQGEVRYDDEPSALTDEERASGYILTCIAHPIGQVQVDA